VNSYSFSELPGETSFEPVEQDCPHLPS